MSAAPKSRYARLLTNTAVFTVGKLLSKLLVFFMTRMYTAYLSPADYSTADIITNAANLLIPLACVGITEGIFRNAAAKDGDKEAFFTNGLFVFGIGSLVFLSLSPLINLVPILTGTAWLVVLYVLSSNLHSVVSQYICAVGHTTLYAAQGVLNTVFLILLNILFLPVLGWPSLGWGVEGFVLSTIIADALTTLVLILVTRLWRAVKPRSISRATILSMLKFCLPLVPTTVCWWITGFSDRYMVANMVSDEANGLYSVAYKIPNLLSMAIGIFGSAWRLSSSSEDDPDACRDFYSRVWRVYTTLSFLGAGVLILSCRLFAGILFDDSYGGAWVYIPILTAATVFYGLDDFLGSVYFTARRTKWSMITAFVGAGLNVGLNWLLIPRYEAMGASVATLASYLTVCVLRLVTTRRFIRFRQELGRGLVNTLLLGGLAVAVTLTGRGYGAWPWIAAGGIFAGMLVFNARAVLELLRDGKRMLRGR